MTEQHPINPSTELYQQWCRCSNVTDSLNQAAQWGADQELEACLDWLTDRERFPVGHEAIEELRDARRPKPPSLKEQSLALIDKIQGNKEMWNVRDLDVVRQALEQLE